jgi:hypothetical protein
LRSDRGTLFLPKLRPPQSAGSLFQSLPVFIGRAMHRELEAPSGSIRDLSIVEFSPHLTQASLTMEVHGRAGEALYAPDGSLATHFET